MNQKIKKQISRIGAVFFSAVVFSSFMSNTFYANEQDKLNHQLLKLASSGEWNHYCTKISTFEKLILKGADVNVRDNYGTTPLHHAAKRCNIELCKLLIDKGADINSKDCNDRTPLHYAINSIDGIKEKYNNKISNFYDYYDYYDYFVDARRGYYRLIQFLLDQGADVNAQDNDGNCPLVIANIYGFRDISELLLNHPKLDVNIKDNNGMTLIDYAAVAGWYDGCAVLIDKGAKVIDLNRTLKIIDDTYKNHCALNFPFYPEKLL